MKLINLTKRATQAGFTMIELLVVIAILGILAVAVLAAINPLEQIRRGSDTALKSDSEQLINAIDRFIAFNNYYPWDMKGAEATAIDDAPQRVTNTWVVSNGTASCPVVSILSDGMTADDPPVACDSVFGAASELKPTYKTKVLSENMGGATDATRGLFVFKNTTGVDSNQYVCFYPQSNAFQLEAKNRCVDVDGTGLPGDLVGAAPEVCDCLSTNATQTDLCMICLP